MQDTGKGGASAKPPSNSLADADDVKSPLFDLEEQIPVFQPGSQAMAMFVPLEHSLFDPFDAPKTKAEQLKASLENMEKHSAAVQDNIMFIYERERRRILRHAKILEGANGIVETDVGISAQEEEAMMTFVDAPMPSDADYSTRYLSTYTAPNAPPECPPRQAAILWSLYNAGQELDQLAGYGAHAQGILDEYKKALAQELTSVVDKPAQDGNASQP
ncbi:hypothetical protein CPLU01_08802 [Colletotrichum plurivorum]|uniref:Uncharacterized protein n=1 Tax=Colletotrichum plurivorum TaxID=2175906 RepID=A0A8H6KA89_9PEZI|nr:hypothetical protein CPLU01_08802 [Colletotrichum plurivorum]